MPHTKLASVASKQLGLFLHEWKRHVCGVHRSSLLMVETPHIQKQETKTTNQQNPKPTEQQQQNQEPRNAQEQRSFLSVHHR